MSIKNCHHISFQCFKTLVWLNSFSPVVALVNLLSFNLTKMEESEELLSEPTYWKGPVFVKFWILSGIIIVSICFGLHHQKYAKCIIYCFYFNMHSTPPLDGCLHYHCFYMHAFNVQNSNWMNTLFIFTPSFVSIYDWF